MKNIFKYQIPLVTRSVVRMPIGAKILDIQHQRGDIMMWAIVDESAELENVNFLVLGTGYGLPPDLEVSDTDYYHEKTIQMGILVWHIFKQA